MISVNDLIKTVNIQNEYHVVYNDENLNRYEVDPETYGYYPVKSMYIDDDEILYIKIN